ncbi:MAG: UDP-N-acetyl-D-glucosamine dehydrogenase, partial [bacterium]
FEARFIELAGQVNSYMPTHVCNKAAEALNQAGKSVKGSKVIILGMAYKRNIDDERESPALDIMDELDRKSADLSYIDPYITSVEIGGRSYHSLEFTPEVLAGSDLVIIVTDHDAFDYGMILEKAPLILDTRNAIKDRKSKKVWRL